MKVNNDFIPVILGGGLSAYTLASQFHREYHVRPCLICNKRCQDIENGAFFDIIENKDFYKEAVFLHVLMDFGKKHADKKLLLLFTNDFLAKKGFLLYPFLKKYYSFPVLDNRLWKKLENKEKFYQLCEQYGIDYPKTIVIDKEDYLTVQLPFSFPVAVKASDGIAYSFSSIQKRKKCYRCDNLQELKKTLYYFYHSSYTGRIIIQEFIEGTDDTSYVMNSYSSQDGKVRLMALGHVILENYLPERIGNYDAILPEYHLELYDNLRKFLEQIYYTGYANIDIKYDSRDQKYKVLELNSRPGRASSYANTENYSLIRPFVEEYVYQKTSPCIYANHDFLWTLISVPILKKFLPKEEILKKVEELEQENKVVNPLFYEKDNSPERKMCLFTKLV